MRKGTLEKIIARGPTNGPLHIMVSFAREKYYSSFYTVGVQKWFQHGHPMIGHPKTIAAGSQPLNGLPGATKTLQSTI